MKINKSLDIDLNIISPQRNIQIHEGDIDSIDIVLAVSVDDVSLDLTGLTIKYDATINNYLAEQDANGSVVENKIVIPVTENMTAMPGLLLIDVRMIQGDEVLFTQTISAIVDKAVVNGSTYIDFSKITINQRLNALEEQMTYVEELVDGLDTSKQITSNRRPPQTAPATVDVDFFRVGDTWIYQGFNIVYKLVEVEYNYQPDPEVPAVHKFTWQPLNEYFSYGTIEPPTSATYTPIEYVIGELTFNALPVPEYFKGDTYAQLVSGAVGTLFTLTNSAEVSPGQYTFSWHYDTAAIDAKLEELDSKKVDKSLTIAGIDLEDDITAEELKAALDIEVSDGAKVFFEIFAPPYYVSDNDYCKIGDIWVDKEISTGQGYRVSVLMSKIYISDPGVYYCSWQPVVPASFYINVLPGGGNLPVYRYSETGGNTEYSYPTYRNGDILTVNGSDYECSVSDGSSYSSTYTYSFKRAVSEADISGKEDKSNKVASLSSSSTDDQYPSAKCVYDMIGNIESLLAEV